MVVDHVFVVGIIAAFLTTISFLPQVIKAASTKQTKDLSLAMYIIFACGVSLWLVYGILLGEVPIIIANGLGLSLALYILLLKKKYG